MPANDTTPAGYQQIGRSHRLDRHCPRCWVHRYHWSRLVGNGKRHKVFITCAECGHGWEGKYRKDEWSEE